MRFAGAIAAVFARRRTPKLPRVRLHQPSLHVTAMVATATLVTAFAAASPALQGSFVGANTPSGPAAVVRQSEQNLTGGQLPSATSPTYITHVVPPRQTVLRPGPGNVATVLYQPSGSEQLASPLASDGIPVTALEAYQDAANGINATDPQCHLPWPLLAAIGRVESDHGRFGGAVLRQDGTSTKKIIGPPLNGSGTEVVTDTDGGRLDGDPVYDRAVGPMQFIPSTWASDGVDGNGDGIADPFNIFDAAAAAAHYLCAAGGDLSTTAGQTRAVLTYNHSTDYLNEVLALERTYASNDPGLIIPAAPTVVPPVPVQQPGGAPVPPPVNPGPPLAGGNPTTTQPGSGGAGPTRAPTPSPTHPPAGPGTPSTPTNPTPTTDPVTTTTTPTTPSSGSDTGRGSGGDTGTTDGSSTPGDSPPATDTGTGQPSCAPQTQAAAADDTTASTDGSASTTDGTEATDGTDGSGGTGGTGGSDSADAPTAACSGGEVATASGVVDSPTGDATDSLPDPTSS